MKNPTITKEQFESIGFRQSHLKMEDELNTWSVHYIKFINSEHGEVDSIIVEWFCGTERYEIYRNTERIKNMPQFCGFIPDIEAFNMLYSMFDLSVFYKPKPIN